MAGKEVNELLEGVQNLKLSSDSSTKFDESINKLINKIKLHPNLLSDEGYCKWCSHAGGAGAFGSHTQIQKYIATLEDSDEIVSLSTPEAIKYLFLDIFSTQLNLVLLYTVAKEENKCMEMLKSSKKSAKDFQDLIQSDKSMVHKDEEHIMGIEFALESIKALTDLQFKDKIDCTEMKSFESLKDESKAFILALKVKVYGELFNRVFPMEEFSTSYKVLELDTSHWEWHIMKYKQFRWQRRGTGLKAKTTEDEQKAVENAFENNPKHPICLLRTCQFLAEHVKGFCIARERFPFPFVFVGNRFSNVEEIVSFLKEMAIEFRENFSTFPTWMNEFGKIFSSDLPFDHRDRNLAKQFLLQAVNVAPNSTKTNHRLGIFYSQGRDYLSCEKHLAKAVECDDRNIPAIADLAKSYMRNMETNSEKLKDLFDMDVNLKISSRSNLPLHFLFLKGYFHYKMQEVEQAIDTWERWTTLSKEYESKGRLDGWGSVSFGTLDTIGKVWGWNDIDRNYELRNIRSSIEEKASLSLLCELDLGASQPSMGQSYRGGRGRSRGNRSRSRSNYHSGRT